MSKELEALDEVKTLRAFNLVELKNDKNINKSLDIIEKALQRLEAIDNAKPSEALECLEEIIHEFNEPHYELSGEYSYSNELLKRCENEINTIKATLLKAQENEKKLNRVEKLTQLLFKERRKISQEYIKWCEKNNAVFDDATNMITWVLCIKLKEVLENGRNKTN